MQEYPKYSIEAESAVFLKPTKTPVPKGQVLYLPDTYLTVHSLIQ